MSHRSRNNDSVDSLWKIDLSEETARMCAIASSEVCFWQLIRSPHFRRIPVKIAALVLLSCLTLAVGRDSLAADPDKSAQNAALIRAHHDALNRGDWKDAVTYYAEDTKNFGRPAGRQHVRQILEDIWTTFSGFSTGYCGPDCEGRCGRRSLSREWDPSRCAKVAGQRRFTDGRCSYT